MITHVRLGVKTLSSIYHLQPEINESGGVILQNAANQEVHPKLILIIRVYD